MNNLTNHKNLPVQSPAEALQIDPESLEVANAYLQNPSFDKVAEDLGVSKDLVVSILDRREVKAYVNQVFMNTGFNNRFILSDLMDTIIRKKLADMDEADVGSTKDITEIIALKAKMMKDHMDHELAMAKLNANNVKTQVNMQINDNSGGSRYSALIEKLMGDTIDV